MALSKCPRCQQLICPDETAVVDRNEIVHLSCRRPRDLSSEEQALLLRYCIDHTVARCNTCGKGFRQQELGSELLGYRPYLCPLCRADLTRSVRAHLYGCTMLPREVRRRAKAAHEATARLLKERQQLLDRADVLMREAEAASIALRATIRLSSDG